MQANALKYLLCPNLRLCPSLLELLCLQLFLHMLECTSQGLKRRVPLLRRHLIGLSRRAKLRVQKRHTCIVSDTNYWRLAMMALT